MDQQAPRPSIDPTELHDQLRIRRILTPLRRFLEIESASGAVLLVCTVAALALANSNWAKPFADFWHTPVILGLGQWRFDRTLEFWVNNGLMTVFFFVVGLEIKRELIGGELNEWRKAALPIFGAVGGMVAPALIYLFINASRPESRGWGIPTATDIAFVVGVMALLGRHVPAGLKIFILALAIADDIGAVLIIAFAYTDHFALGWLLVGLGGIGFVVVMNRAGVRQVGAYFTIGFFIWLAFLKADVHPTVAGVLLGLVTPAAPLVRMNQLGAVAKDAMHRVEGDDDADSGRQRAIMINLASTATEAVSPLERLEAKLHPVVGFIIMPIFALCNAGVALNPNQVTSPIALAVAAGLVIGKPIGIVTFTYLSICLGLARLPSKTSWRHMIGAGCLGGIGFTMAIFIAGLAFPGDPHKQMLSSAKIGVFIGSVISALIGAMVLLTSKVNGTDASTVVSQTIK